MRDRLIELIQNEDTYDEYECELCVKTDCLRCYGEKFADYLIANGVIVPPVKVGQTVWFIRPTEIKQRVVETSVEKIVVKTGGVYMKLACNAMYETSCRSIGKTVFLSREDAEKALKGGAE